MKKSRLIDGFTKWNNDVPFGKRPVSTEHSTSCNDVYEALRAICKPLTDIYSELLDFLLQDIALRISKAAKITDTAEYQMYRAKALGMFTDAIKKRSRV